MISIGDNFGPGAQFDDPGAGRFLGGEEGGVQVELVHFTCAFGRKVVPPDIGSKHVGHFPIMKTWCHHTKFAVQRAMLPATSNRGELLWQISGDGNAGVEDVRFQVRSRLSRRMSRTPLPKRNRSSRVWIDVTFSQYVRWRSSAARVSTNTRSASSSSAALLMGPAYCSASLSSSSLSTTLMRMPKECTVELRCAIRFTGLQSLSDPGSFRGNVAQEQSSRRPSSLGENAARMTRSSRPKTIGNENQFAGRMKPGAGEADRRYLSRAPRRHRRPAPEIGTQSGV
jgi:hypothetical protein